MKPCHSVVENYLSLLGIHLSKCQLRDVCDALYATKCGLGPDWLDGIDGPDEEQARFRQALRERGWNEESIRANFGPRPVALNQAEASDQDWWA